MPVALFYNGDVNNTNTGWTVAGREMSATATNWLINAFVVCGGPLRL